MKVLGVGGGCITKGPIIFSWDNRYILLAQETTIMVLDGTTAKLLGCIETAKSRLESAKSRPESTNLDLKQSNTSASNGKRKKSIKNTTQNFNEAIISMALHPTMPSQVFTASADGVISLWHYEAGHLIHSIRAPHRIASLITAKGHETLYINCTISTHSTHPVNDAARTDQTTDATDPSINGPVAKKAKTMGKRKKSAPILTLEVNNIQRDNPFGVLTSATQSGTANSAISADGKRFIFTSRTGVTYWDIANDSQRKRMQVVDLNFEPTRLALHPSLPQAYWTNGSGSIFVKRFSILTDASSPLSLPAATTATATAVVADAGPPTKMHWHAHAALTIAPSLPDGLYLLSGGDEGVLVAWHLATGNRQFLPHLGSSVLRVACSHDGAFYAVLLRSNSLVIISPGTLSPIARYDALPFRPAIRRECHIGLVRDPRHPSTVLMNASTPGSIVAFDVLRNEMLKNQEIDACQQGYVGRGNRRPILSDVFCISASSDGKWLATFDCRPPPPPTIIDAPRCDFLEMLRFWKLNKNGIYTPYTSIDSPHTSPLTSLVMAPIPIGKERHYMCLSLAGDGRVRVWKSCGNRVFGLRQDNSRKISQRISWMCVEDLEFLDLVPRAASFHSSGKYFVVAFDGIIVVYETETLKMIGSSNPSSSSMASPVREMAFVGDFLVGTDGEYLYSWLFRDRDDFTKGLKLQWMARLPPCKGIKPLDAYNRFAIIVHPQVTPSIKATAAASIVLIFNPEQGSTPICAYGHDTKMLAVDFVSLEWDSAPVLVFYDEKGKSRILSLNGISDEIILPIDPASEAYKNQQQRLAKSMATQLAINPDERPMILDHKRIVERRPLPIFARVDPDVMLMSKIPGHELPSTIEAFNHFVKFKFPQQVVL